MIKFLLIEDGREEEIRFPIESIGGWSGPIV